MKILFYINLGFFNYNLLTKKLQQYKFSEKKEKHNQYKFLQNNKFNNNQKNYLLYGSLLIGVSLILILISIYFFKSKNQK